MSEPLEFLLRHGYLVLFGVVLGEQLGLPLVGAPVLLAAGALAATGRFTLPLLLLLPVSRSIVSTPSPHVAVWKLGRRSPAPVHDEPQEILGGGLRHLSHPEIVDDEQRDRPSPWSLA